MRIGIITFHHAYNYGAFLQTEGLYGHLRALGHDSEIIDYRHPGLEAVHERCIRYGIHPLRKLAGYRRRDGFIQALDSLQCSPRYSTPNDIDWSRYDAVVYGSDEIWNHHSHVHGFEPVFFGGSTPEDLVRVAYAPSLGELDQAKHPSPPEVTPLMARYSRIAVRDNNTATFVERATGTRPAIVVDPVFLHHRQVDPSQLSSSQPYMLVYGEIRGKEWILACREHAKRHGCKTLSVGYRNPWCDKVLLSSGPHEFLGWIQSAAAVLTTTFHGTMFSIKFGKPFTTLRPQGSRKKFDPLLDELGLTGRMLGTPAELRSGLPDIDWTEVSPSLDRRVRESIDFLGMSLGA